MWSSPQVGGIARVRLWIRGGRAGAAFAGTRGALYAQRQRGWLSGLGQDARTWSGSPEGGSERERGIRRDRSRRGDASRTIEGRPRSLPLSRIREREGRPQTSGRLAFGGSAPGRSRLRCDRDAEAPAEFGSADGKPSSVPNATKCRSGGHAKTCPSRRRRRPWRGNVGVVALARSKGLLSSDEGPRESQERSADETSRTGFEATETVESVRNAEDGTCPRLAAAGVCGRLGLWSAVGNGTPREVHVGSAPMCG